MNLNINDFQLYYEIREYKTPPWINSETLLDFYSKDLKISSDELSIQSIKRKSIDMRKKGSLSWNFVLAVKKKSNSIIKEIEKKRGFLVKLENENKPEILDYLPKHGGLNPLIIGAGISGLMVAYHLAKSGYSPLIIEQGKNIDERIKDVKKLFVKGIVNSDSNVQFGLGGAGTFSDGKINSRTKNIYKNYFLKLLVQFGGKSEIIYEAMPHLGTDGIRKIVNNIKLEIEKNGGKFLFNSKVIEIIIKNGKIRSVELNSGDSIKTENLFLAIGNSSRELFRVLDKNGVTLRAKPIAVGFRVEHRQEIINNIFYKNKHFVKYFGAASYNMKSKDFKNPLYSFCVCPGGIIVNSSTKRDNFSINGMSYSGRRGNFINGAFITPVEPSGNNNPLEILEFQEEIEYKVAELSDFNSLAPAQRMEDFLMNVYKSGELKTTFRPGVFSSDLSKIYPYDITVRIRKGLIDIKKRYKNFSESIMVGVETRTSSPVWILRNKNYESVSVSGIYPIGEGAGFAGGILTSGIDGIMAAIAFTKNCRIS